MWISPEEAKVEKFKSSCGERVLLWLCVGGIVLFGIASCVYEYCYHVVLG